jgi:hypothetical protein
MTDLIVTKAVISTIGRQIKLIRESNINIVLKQTENYF